MKCEYCDIIERKSKSHVLYEDNEVLVVIKDMVMNPGQITVFPKEHLTIMEMVPDEILTKCAVMANKVGTAVFDGLGAQGTNVIVQNGLGAGQKIPHFAFEVVPRTENDGLDLQWQSKQLTEVEVDSVFEVLKEEVGKDKKEKKKTKKDEVVVKDEDTEMKLKKGKKNYLLKSLRRVP
jgi:histidine triad (HIT) family protein